MGKALVWLVNTVAAVACAAMTVMLTVPFKAGVSNISTWLDGLGIGHAPGWLAAKSADHWILALALALTALWFGRHQIGRLVMADEKPKGPTFIVKGNTGQNIGGAFVRLRGVKKAVIEDNDAESQTFLDAEDSEDLQVRKNRHRPLKTPEPPKGE